MNALFQFLDAHPWPGCLAGCLVLPLGAWLVVVAATLAARTIKVLVRGWPPEHLDADGDFKSVDEGDAAIKNQQVGENACQNNGP